MKIVAIGGGEIGRPNNNGGRYPIETRAIDKEIIKLTGKTHPKALLLPTASGDSEGYYSTFERYYGKMLGCKTDVLYLIKERPSKKEIRRRILSSDIIYVGGGNTLRMLKLWRRLGVDKMLEEAGNRGIVLSGLSAGDICWFDYANSDSMKFGPKKQFKMIMLKGLGFIPLMSCPHYNVEKNRHGSLKKMIQKHGGVSIALDNCAAIEVIDDKYKIITSSSNAKAYRVHRKNGKVIEEPLPLDKKFRPLEELIV
ncbi:MAG: peptidase E [Nanoarchaeota archaeon]